MGYNTEIPTTGSTSIRNFKIFWTDKGREFLSGVNPDKTGLLVKYFTLSDRDINYNMINKNLDDFVPSVAGLSNIDCIRGTKQVDIKDEIGFSGATTP